MSINISTRVCVTVCTSVCVCVNVYMCVRARTHDSMRVNLLCVRVCTSMHVLTRVSVYAYICMRMFMGLCFLCGCVRIHVRVALCACMNVSVRTYTLRIMYFMYKHLDCISLYI